MVNFGDQIIIGIIQFSDWFSQFKSGAMTVENTAHSGCTSTSKTHKTVDQEKAVVIKNKRITIHKVANMLGISFGSVQSILMDNGQWKNVWNLLINILHLDWKKICANRDNLESRHFELNWLRVRSNKGLLYQQHQTSTFKSI